ncbi:DUF4349 domain-containing protein [Chloroflexota bacterium]
MKKCIIAGFLLITAVTLFFSGCGGGEDETWDGVSPGSSEYPFSTATITQVQYNIDAGQMIVRTADIYIVVEDIGTGLDDISSIASRFGGYVVSSNNWQESARTRGNIVIRVLAENYDSALDEISELAVEVTSRSETSEDVTEEYVDLEAKLHNLEAAESQLLLLMEKAESVDDILAIQNEITDTREEIELIKGRMQYLERTSATSLIEVNLEEAGIKVEFTVNSRNISQGEEVFFTASVSGGFTPYSYEWDFGDGQTSTDSSPSHSYRSQGNYTVSLSVTDDRGNTDTYTRTSYVNVAQGWNAGSVAERAWNGLITFGKALVNIIIWLAIFSPVWIAIGAVIFLLRRRSKR